MTRVDSVVPAAPSEAPGVTGAEVTLSAAPERSEAADRAAQLFEDAYGYAPDGVWSAPGRVNIIGEHVRSEEHTSELQSHA